MFEKITQFLFFQIVILTGHYINYIFLFLTLSISSFIYIILIF